MITKITRRIKRRIKSKHIRNKLSTFVLIVFKSNLNFYVQIVNHDRTKVLFSSSSIDKSIKYILLSEGAKYHSFRAVALIAEILMIKLRARNIRKILFDRSGYSFHGKVKFLFFLLKTKNFIADDKKNNKYKKNYICQSRW